MDRGFFLIIHYNSFLLYLGSSPKISFPLPSPNGITKYFHRVPDPGLSQCSVEKKNWFWTPWMVFSFSLSSKEVALNEKTKRRFDSTVLPRTILLFWVHFITNIRKEISFGVKIFPFFRFHNRMEIFVSTLLSSFIAHSSNFLITFTKN
mgnify:CR=1 FL=1